MDVGWMGVAFVWGYFFWPLIISTTFTAFIKTNQKEFFLASLVVGYVVFVIPHIFQFTGLIKIENKTANDLLFFGPMLLPVISTTVFTIYTKK